MTMRFELPPRTRRDVATSKLARGMGRVKEHLKTVEWMGLAPDTLAEVRARYNVVAREADALCGRRLTVKRHERRARAIVSRANAVYTWALTRMVDDMARPDYETPRMSFLGPGLRSAERDIWFAPINREVRFSDWSDMAHSTPIEDLLAVRDLTVRRGTTFGDAGPNWQLLNHLLLACGVKASRVMFDWTREQTREAQAWAEKEYTRRYVNAEKKAGPMPDFLKPHVMGGQEYAD
jgi:hypothetical protein